MEGIIDSIHKNVKKTILLLFYTPGEAWRRFASFLPQRDMIVLTDDGSTIVCYHPEKDFPYEHSRVLINQYFSVFLLKIM